MLGQALLPHGYCFLWQPGVMWLHIVSDAIIALAYFSIPPVLFWLVRRRADAPFKWVVGMFSAFIMLCGATHVFSIIVLWEPWYWAEGCLKLLTAIVSIATAISLIPVLPSLLKLPSPIIDQLTALPNRTLFNDRLQRAILRARREGGYFAVLFIDLDGFKAINDTRGHHTGDLLLIEIGRRLQRAARASDTVARYGGDEFVVLLEKVGGPATAKAAATRVLEALGQPVQLGEEWVTTTASIGIVVSTGAAEADEIIAGADRAMYESKTKRRGSFELLDELIARSGTKDAAR